MAAPDVIGSGTAGGLTAFCDYLVDRHLAPGSTVNPWKSAAKQVFTRLEGDNFETIDVQSLDVDEYMQRFMIASRSSYKPESLTAYDNRFRKGVEAYRGYLADPMGWRPKLRASSRRSPDSGTNGRTGAGISPSDPAAPSAALAPSAAVSTAAPAMPGLTDYPFPLRSGQMAHLHLPSPLDKDDAERLTQFLRALVFERQQQLPPGDTEED
jgi:hypothetical protein